MARRAAAQGLPDSKVNARSTLTRSPYFRSLRYTSEACHY